MVIGAERRVVSQPHPEAPDAGFRQASACVSAEDLGEWVELAFSGSEPRESATGMVPEKVQATGPFGIRRLCVWKVLIECSLGTR